MPDQAQVETAIRAAFQGPEVKKIDIDGHHFNVKPMHIQRPAPGHAFGVGRISHHFANRPDDQIDYTLRIVDGVAQKPEMTVDPGGWSAILQAIAIFIPDSWSESAGLNEGDIAESVKQAEMLINGSWEGSLRYLLAVFTARLAANASLGQMSGALTIARQGFAVFGAIGDKYAQLGGRRGFLGRPLTSEMRTPDGVGRFNHFQNGSIYWTPQTGAQVIYGAIRDKWANDGWERGPLGYPISDERYVPGGRASYFQHGRIVWSRTTGAYVELGALV